VVLDIDVKRPEANGFDSLEDLDIGLPATPMAHTATGGLHVYFDPDGRELKNSAGRLGPGLDVRGDGGFIIVPAPGSGSEWDPQHNFSSDALAPAPDWLWPPKPARPATSESIRPVEGLSPYGKAAIEAACNAIVGAGPGQQERALNAECFSIGTLAGAGASRAQLRNQHCSALAIGCPTTIPLGHGGRKKSTSRLDEHLVPAAPTRGRIGMSDWLPDVDPVIRHEQEKFRAVAQSASNGLDPARGPQIDLETLSGANWLTREIPEPEFLLGELISTTSRI